MLCVMELVGKSRAAQMGKAFSFLPRHGSRRSDWAKLSAVISVLHAMAATLGLSTCGYLQSERAGTVRPYMPEPKLGKRVRDHGEVSDTRQCYC